MKPALVGLLALTALAGCASSNDNLQRATAMAINNNTAVDAVKISDVDRSAMSVKWNASTPGGDYACSADDMVRRPYCTKK